MVVQTVLTATFNSYGDRQISTLYKINTPEPIDKKFSTVDYAREGTLYTKFDTYPPTGGFWANGWNITNIIFYLYLVFSGTRTGQTRGWIFTRDSSKDVKSRKNVPFGGLNDVPLNFGDKTHQKNQILGAWTTKISNPYNWKTTDPTMTKFLQGVRTTSVPSWVVPWLPQQIQDGGGRHVFGKMSTTPHWIKVSAPNFTGRCTTAMRRWTRDQKSKPEVNSRDVIKWTSEA